MERWSSELWRGASASPSADVQGAQAWVNMAGHYSNRRHFMHRDVTRDAQVAFCAAGEGIIRVGNSERMVRAGDCFNLPPHIPHTYYADHRTGWDLWWLHYGGSYAEHLAHYAGFTASQPVISLHDRATSAIACFACIIDLLEAKPTHYQLDATRELLALFLHIKKSSVVSPGLCVDLASMLDYRTNSLDAIAASLGYSKYHFIRRFQQTTGSTPWRYIIQLKIDKAKELLLDERLSVRQVAHAVGMADANYFSRCFKRHVGLSPIAFRKATTNQALTCQETSGAAPH